MTRRLARSLVILASIARASSSTVPRPPRDSPTPVRRRDRRRPRPLRPGAISSPSTRDHSPSAFVPPSAVVVAVGGRPIRERGDARRERNGFGLARRPTAGSAEAAGTTAPSAEAEASNGASSGDDADRVDRGLRFGGVGRLYAGMDAAITPEVVLDRLSAATVAVIGLGGVGSWAAESLCRSGVGNLILVDLDDICISNTNRQLHATSSAVGRMKIDETRRRLLDINPRCDVTLVHDFVTSENADDLVGGWGPQLTACVDAIDGMQEKAALILACVGRGVPVVTCGGAAGRTDPTKIVVDDLTKVTEDRLLFKCRKLLRQRHGFPKVPMPGTGGKGGNRKNARVRKWRIPAVYSTEVRRRTTTTGTTEEGEEDAPSSFRECDGALGTACFVTGAYGLAAARAVVEMIALDGLVAPKRLGQR